MIKKKPSQSALRYCQCATEVPHSTLMRHRRFTVALAGSSQARNFHSPHRTPAPYVMGILHGAATFADGSEEPVLPVRITFEDSPPSHGASIGSGYIDQHYGANENFYVLELSVSDPDHSIFLNIDRALERAAISQERFVHLECRQSDWLEKNPNKASITDQISEDDNTLKAIRDGKAKFPIIRFDELLFTDEVLLHSQSWAWAWPTFEFGGPSFQSPGVAKWRADRAKWYK